MEGNLTKGPILKTLTKLAVPIMASSFLGTLYNITDMAWIGLLGSRAVAGVGVGGMFTWLSQGLAAMARMGGQVHVAQCIGRGDRERAHGFAQAAVQLAAFMGMAYAILSLLFTRQMVGFFQLADAQAHAAAMSYTRIACGLIVFSFMTLTLTGLYTAQGDSKTPLIFLIVASVLNVILDLIFVLSFGWGVVGAGVATAFSQLISALACIIYAYKSNTYFKLKKKNIKLNGNIIKKSCKLGIPVALQNSLIAFSLIVLQKVVNGYGATFTTAFTVVSRIETLVQQPFMSLGAAVSTYTGQNIGAGLKDRVRKGFNSATLVSSIFALAIGVVFWIFAPSIASIFGKDADVIRIGANGLRITCCFYIFLGLIYTTRNVLNGAGDAMFSLFTGIVECIGRVGFAYPMTLIPFMGKYGVFYATGLTWFLNGMFSLIRYKRGKWKKIDVISKVKG